MNLTLAQLADLRAIVAERIGAPEITDDRMICPACGGDDYGPTVHPSQLAYYVYDNLLPSYLRGVCCSDRCGHVQEPTSLYVVQVTTDHLDDLRRAPKGSVIWLNYPEPSDGLPFLEIVPEKKVVRSAVIVFQESTRPGQSADLSLWQSRIGALFPPF